jgi:hypothetical protein
MGYSCSSREFVIALYSSHSLIDTTYSLAFQLHFNALSFSFQNPKFKQFLNIISGAYLSILKTYLSKFYRATIISEQDQKKEVFQDFHTHKIEFIRI